MKRIAIYGGSFNPPHIGHLRAAQRFIEETKADSLVIMPSFIPPHKFQADFASVTDRIQMCRLTFESIPLAVVSDAEILRGGKSYTYLTLEELSEDDTELYFLVGTDMLLTMDSWMCPDRIFKHCTVCYIRREDDIGMKKEIDEYVFYLSRKYNAEIIEISADVTELSSTEIRDRARRGEDISALVVPAVSQYISSKRVYS